MPRLPLPGGDEGEWGNILNEYLSVAHTADGALKDAATIAGKYTRPATGIPEADLSTAVQSKLNAVGGGGSSVTSINQIDGTAVTAEVDVNSQKVVNLAAPTAANDAATKAYVDTATSSGPTDTRVVITHSASGTLTLDHSAGNYFDVNATANITAIAETNLPSGGVGEFWLRIYANGVTVTIDLTDLELDSALAAVTSIPSGEALIAQGVILP